MADLIASNNPNNAWGKHHVEIVLQCWRYTGTYVEQVGGNCLGFDLFDTAIENLYETLEGEIILTNPEGDTLHCEDEEDREADWLKKMVVSCRVIAFDPPTLNEVRKRNGAKPVPNGDVPYAAMGDDPPLTTRDQASERG